MVKDKKKIPYHTCVSSSKPKHKNKIDNLQLEKVKENKMKIFLIVKIK